MAAALAKLSLDDRERQQVLAIAALTATAPMAEFFYEQILAGNVEPRLLAQALPIAVAEVDPVRRDLLVGYLRQHFADDRERQIQLLKQVCEALARRGIHPSRIDTRRFHAATLLGRSSAATTRASGPIGKLPERGPVGQPLRSAKPGAVRTARRKFR